MKSLKDSLIDRIRPGMSREEYDAMVLEEINRIVDYAEYTRDVQNERGDNNAIYRPNK